MGILNVTPDSFSDKRRFDTPRKALRRAKEMFEQGVDIIDIGGESTGPGSKEVSVDEELERVIPVVSKIKERFNVLVSVDTYKSKVAEEALKLGVEIINDVTALRGDANLGHVVAQYGAYLVLMYSKDPTPRTTLEKKKYQDVTKEIKSFLRERVRLALMQKIKKEQIILDPGMGAFVSMDPAYSFEIINRLTEFKELGFPLLVGTSRKSYLGGKTKERLVPSLITSALSVYNGTSIVRVHDVAETRQMIDIVEKFLVTNV
ncbi:MAG TPA: dihydropteroate synthase [Candidatus Peregrinibacteria bacterium]|nr:dihydropteroate synthase [Candidatus Peregrinibacteria bacterium]